MKELYLTVTDLAFVREGSLLARGRVITASARPLPLGALWEEGEEETPRLGLILPAPGETPLPGGTLEAALEGREGYALTLTPRRFALRKKAAQAGAGGADHEARRFSPAFGLQKSSAHKRAF